MGIGVWLRAIAAKTGYEKAGKDIKLRKAESPNADDA